MKQKIKVPLARLLRKDTPFVWGADQEQAFATLKQSLSEAPVLVRPDFDKEICDTNRRVGLRDRCCVDTRERRRWSATPTRSNGVRLPPLSGEQPEGLHRQSGRRWTSERGRRAPRETPARRQEPAKRRWLS
ncbi:unnamed protein product [Trichogramma brassicae]|uniref:Reverse transcriptase/retrotransposon-derived protein RNase H-like domain-containing protein n=1 Tax=Trichogramma brassicae TaxID=86971 RepID=A0A6H5IXB8_9HYME|nr:unnamed protein product [Trichogramma brassicae]